MQNISLSYLLNLALKRLWILILATVVFAVSAFAYSKLVLVPVYSSTASILVTNGGVVFFEENDNNNGEDVNKKAISGSDFSSSATIAENVVELLKSPNKYIKFAEKLGGNYTYNSVMGKASIRQRKEDSIFIDISFSSTDGAEAKDLANAYANFACEEIPNDIKNAEVSPVSDALTYRKVSPNVFYYTVITAIIGLLLSYATVFVIDISDQSIRGEDEFVERYDLPLIGSVPDFETMADATNNKYSYISKGGYFGGK